MAGPDLPLTRAEQPEKLRQPLLIRSREIKPLAVLQEHRYVARPIEDRNDERFLPLVFQGDGRLRLAVHPARLPGIRREHDREAAASREPLLDARHDRVSALDFRLIPPDGEPAGAQIGRETLDEAAVLVGIAQEQVVAGTRSGLLADLEQTDQRAAAESGPPEGEDETETHRAHRLVSPALADRALAEVEPRPQAGDVVETTAAVGLPPQADRHRQSLLPSFERNHTECVEEEEHRDGQCEEAESDAGAVALSGTAARTAPAHLEGGGTTGEKSASDARQLEELREDRGAQEREEAGECGGDTEPDRRAWFTPCHDAGHPPGGRSCSLQPLLPLLKSHSKSWSPKLSHRSRHESSSPPLSQPH